MAKPVLDPCCGSRMMWFDKNDSRAVFGDQRIEEIQQQIDHFSAFAA